MTDDEAANDESMTNDRMTSEDSASPEPVAHAAEGAERTPFDLEERTARFGEAVIAFARKVFLDEVSAPLVRQLVRSATSIGANYGEANDAESRKDFRHKIGVCRKEPKETMHWLRMVAAAVPAMREAAVALWKEAKELKLIFGKIRRSVVRR